MSEPSPISGIQLRLVLCLARDDTAAVAVTRRVLDAALLAIDVSADCRGDLAVAVTEACANAVVHAHGCHEYQVTVSVHGDQCAIEVTDTGIGPANGRVTARLPEPTAEGGRGLHVIRACTDRMELRPVRPHGLAVRMVKTLTWKPDQPVLRTAAAYRNSGAHQR